MAELRKVSYNNYGYSVLIEPYCENCLEFEPICIDSDVSSFDRPTISHKIYCKHREKCARMNTHIQRMRSKVGQTDASQE